jgi:hypothetical protein
MHTRKRGGALLAVLAFAFLLAARSTAAAQGEGVEPPPRPQSSARGEINYEVQLHMLVTAEGAEGAFKVPQSLDAVVRQLKSALPPAEYRLGATFVNRVRDGGNFDVRSMGAAPYAPATQGTQGAQWKATYQYSMGGVKLADESAGERFIRVQGVRFGLSVPIQTTAAGGGQSLPVIQYEDVGISTQVSLRDGEPTLIGTLNTSRPGQLFAVVLTIKRVGK